MTESRESCSENEVGVKLFVAGVPSGISQQLIVDFFKSYGHLELATANNATGWRQSTINSKGHIILNCYDRLLAKDLIAQRNFNFLGRTLAVSEFMSGQDLISLNHKLNKCRVILKKVPSHIDQATLRSELSSKWGPLENIFQFKPMNPMDTTKLKKTEPPKYHVYSAIFKDPLHANKLIKYGFFDLSDGSRVQTEKFTKPKGNFKEKEMRYKNGHHSQKVRQNPWAEEECNRHIQKEKSQLAWHLNMTFERPITSLYFKNYESPSVDYPYDHNFNNLRINTRKGQPAGFADYGLMTYFTLRLQSTSSSSSRTLGKPINTFHIVN